VGKNGGSITTSYSTGSTSGDNNVGGLVGRNYDSFLWDIDGTIETSYSTSIVSGTMKVGGLVGNALADGRIITSSFWDVETSGQSSSDGGTGKTTAEMQDINTYLSAGWDFADEILNGTCDYWLISPGEYPRLRYQGENLQMPEGFGTAEQPYLIRDYVDLGTVWLEPLAHYRLKTSLDLSGIAWSMAVIPWFGGTFDGNGHVIRNLHIQGGRYLGLFGQLGPGAIISNLALEAVNVNGTGDCVGGLVGWNEGSITSSYSAGSVSGDADVGGLVGWNGGSITSCYSTGLVSGIGHVGGLVGSNLGGWAAVGIVNSSFWDMETSGHVTSAGGTGKTTAEMQTESTFTDAGWDFVGESANGTDDIWWILEGQDYPRLWRQYGSACCPDPANGATNISRSPILQWVSWGAMHDHDVYLGQDADMVAKATPESQGVYRGQQPTGVTTYEPGVLDWGRTYYWRVDEVKEGDPNSPWKGSVWRFTVADATSSPDPLDGASDVSHEPTLSWVPGGPELQYDVYFGGDPDEIANATRQNLGIYCGRQLPEMTTYQPGHLEWGKTYYWRVDGVDEAGPNSPWKGSVWSFTTANFVVVDDFESYTDHEVAGEAIWQTWIDGHYTDANYPGNGTGSMVSYLMPPFAEQRIVHGGRQSMPMAYNNVSEPYYSEAERTWETPQDWTIDGADTLTLYLRGEADNAPEPLYVAVEDGGGRIAVVTHPDADAVLATEWRRWDISLADLQAAGVDVASVRKMYIGVGDRDNPQPGGTGRIYIDDIRLTRRML
jgi:hypothetical protein